MTDVSSSDPGEGSGGLARRAAASALWSVVQNFVTRVTAFVTVLVLARLLSPRDFGVVAIVATLIPILQVVADLGITVYILQHRKPTKLIYDTYFWTSSSIALVGGVIMFFFAPLIAPLLGEPAAGPVLQGLAPTALLVTLGAVPQTRLRRELRYKAIAIQSTIAAVLSQVVAVIAAVLGAGVWALVLQTLTAQFVVNLLAWIIVKYRPAFQFSRSELVRMVSFGGNYVVSTALQAGAQFLINLVITQTLGVSALGYLNIVQRLVNVVINTVMPAVVQVSTVAFSMLRDEAERLRSGYLRSFSTMYAFLVPAIVFVAASAQHLVPFMYGDQWGPSIIPGELLAFAALFVVDSLDHALYAGLGRPKMWTLYTLYSALLLVAAAWIGSAGGLIGVAVAELIVNIVVTLIRWFLTARMLGTGWWTISRLFGRVSIAGTAAAIAGYLVAWASSGLPDLVSVILVGFSVVVVYLPLLRITSPTTWSEIETLIRHAAGRFLRRGTRPSPQL